MNPTEKEPAWVRDTAAGRVGTSESVEERPMQALAEVCEGEKSFCEQCGAEFSMWPTKGWANHLVVTHGDALTIQARTGTSLLCSDELNEAQLTFFGMMLASRVSMRRRAWKLGYLVETIVPGRIKLSN